MTEPIEKKILLVDDEEDIREVLGISLSDLGYDVYTAETGEEGLEIFSKITPPIVLTDIKMPGIDGIELLRKIKTINPNTEVVMITGHGDMDLAIKSFKDEASDFITKPVDVGVLETTLKRVCEKILIRKKLRDYTVHLEKLLEKKTAALRETQQTSQTAIEAPRTDEKTQVPGRFRDLFNQLPCYITLQDRDLTFTSVNSRFKEDFGDKTGFRCYTVWKHRNIPCSKCPVIKTFADGESHQMEEELIAKSGRKINVLVWTSPIRETSGKVTKVLIMATNIEQVLDLQDHLSSLGLMIGSVSHGIKGLLTGLDGGLYLMDSGLCKDDKDQLREGLEITKEMAGKIRNMVLDILFYAKDRELDREVIKVKEFAKDVAEVAAPKFEQLGIEFIREFERSMDYFNVDTRLLHSALINVLDNAADACTEDKSKASHHVKFAVKKQKDQILFEIIDNGIGIAPETSEKIFDIFFSAKGKQGTGLGLFITQKIVKQHGGKISASSQKGRGTCMTIRIPITR
jgi:signal transduction histidine kinase/FixJ family two-component response regulator